MHEQHARLPGLPRLERGHRHVGGQLGRKPEERHYTAIVGAVITAIATAVSTYAQVEAGQQQADAARYQAKIQRNQAVATQQAADQAASENRARNERIMARNRAALGVSGIQLEGSPLLALLDEAQQGELEARNIEVGGQRAATGYTAQSALSRFYAGRAQLSGQISAGQSLLTGATSLYRIYDARRSRLDASGGFVE